MDAGDTIRLLGSPLVRFWQKVDVIPNGCWLWTAHKDESGYGTFNDGERSAAAAHRYAYETYRESIPAGLQLDHLCRVRHCVQPWHLEPVTAQVNTLRGEGVAARNAAKTECPKGHPYDETNTYINGRGSRECKVCMANRQRARAARRKSSTT